MSSNTIFYYQNLMQSLINKKCIQNCSIIKLKKKLQKTNMNQKISWKQVKMSPQSNQRPCSRWGHSCCVIKDQIVLFGGYANSIYMNDMWVFNTHTMQWKQINTTGQKPCPRSNCSLHYDSLNNRLVVFGGGGQNKRRLNQINLISWQSKEWTCITFSQNETAPWERTYHSAQLLYPYLIIYGGQGVADLDDLWIYSFQTSKWSEVTFLSNSVRPCARRFHTSCLIGNEFFVIAGCYSKYRPLNDIFSIDLTKLIQTGSVQGLQWKQRVLNEQGYLTRWGHSTAVKGNNIYIFGGRFSNDLSDILLFNAKKNKIRVLKVSNQSTPKPRRRSSLNFIGNCLLMFGGFNSDYYNDLHYINVTQNNPKVKRNQQNFKIQNLIYQKQLSDLEIRANNGKIFYCHKGVLMQSMKYQETLNRFVEQIQEKEQQKQLQQMLQCLYKGYGQSKLLNKYLIDLPEDLQEKQYDFTKHMDQYRKSNMSQSLHDLEKNSKQMQNIIQLQDDQYKLYMSNWQQNSYSDISISMSQSGKNAQQVLSNKCLLYLNSKYFQNSLSTKFNRKDKNITIMMNCGVDKLRIVNNYLMVGHLIVPAMSHLSWIQLYTLSDYLSLSNLENLILSQLFTMISQGSLQEIFQFASKNRLEQLAVACVRHNLSKNYKLLTKNKQNKYYKIGYEQNRFEIEQELMTKNTPIIFKSKNSEIQNMEDQKENSEICQN